MKLYTCSDITADIPCRIYEAEDGDILVTDDSTGIETVCYHYGFYGRQKFCTRNGVYDESVFIRYSERKSLKSFSCEGCEMDAVGDAYADDCIKVKQI